MKDRIRQLMEIHHMNQQAFANYTGINNATLSNIFNGKTNPSLSHVYALRNKFPTINLDWLVEGTGPMFLTDEKTDQPKDGEDTTANQTSQPAATSTTASDNEPTAAPATANPTSTPPLQNAPYDPAVQQNDFRPGGQMQKQRVPATANLSDPRDRSVASIPRMEMIAQRPERKITEIRIFYDDQTWESFVPKK